MARYVITWAENPPGLPSSTINSDSCVLPDHQSDRISGLAKRASAMVTSPHYQPKICRLNRCVSRVPSERIARPLPLRTMPLANSQYFSRVRNGAANSLHHADTLGRLVHHHTPQRWQPYGKLCLVRRAHDHHIGRHDK